MYGLMVIVFELEYLSEGILFLSMLQFIYL